MQSTKHSLLETLATVGSGFVMAIVLTYLVLPIWGFNATWAESGYITLIHTVAALIRVFIVRRISNAIQERKANG